MDLRETQRLFWRAITWPTGVADFLAHADADTRRAFEETFAETPGFPRRERVDVYAESYYWRLEAVLREQYRVAAWLLGDVAFHDLCTDFVLHMPSREPDVRRYGEPFVAFVAAHAIAREHAGIVDVVAIEHAAVRAIDAADVPLMRTGDLAEVPIERWPELRLLAAPGVALLPSSLPYAALWQARDRGEAAPDPFPPPLPDPQHVLVWRKRLEVFHRSVPLPEARALAAVLAGASFAEVCAAAATGDATDPETLVTFLRRWLDDEVVAAPSAGGLRRPEVPGRSGSGTL